nr:DegV family protein [Anaerolineae bacterium]
MIRVVTDSGIDLPQEIMNQYRIRYVPGRIAFGDEVVKSGYEMPPEEFYRRVAASDRLPQQRDSTVRDFREIYQEVLDETPGTAIISIHVSSVLAATINNARLAAASFPHANIHLFDTLSASVGLGLLVWEAARMAGEGISASDILKRLEAARKGLSSYFILNTLDNLAKGGRMGSMAHVVGSLLNVKPVLMLKDGAIESYARPRSREASITALKTLVLDSCKDLRNVRLGVGHAVCEEEAKPLFDELVNAIQPAHATMTEIGPSIGTHVGAGSITACWFGVDE